MNAAEWLIKGLQDRGVQWMATLCGHGLDPLFEAARRAGMRLVDTRNEQTASYIADYSGRLTRRPGVCAVSSGVAHANALTGVMNAWFDGSPMLLISGAGALRTAGMGHFQDCDQAGMAAPVAKYSRVLDCADRVLEILDEAMALAAAPAPGPVHLTFPMDVQMTEVPPERLIQPIARPANCPRQARPDEVAEALAKSVRPLIVAGSGLYYAQTGAAMLDFSERCSAPVVVPIWDRGAIDRPAATFMGVVGAASGGPRLLPDADLILMAGAAPDYRVGFLQPDAVRNDARILYFERGWEELRGGSHVEWLEEARLRRDEFRARVRQSGEAQARAGLHAIHILAALEPALRDDPLLLIDGGSIGQWAHQLLCDRYPGHWLTCGRSGVVGWGIGGAMAARLAYPERPVILLSGDGAFTFNVAELECAVRQRLPFVAIVADDQAWGITKAGHLQKFGEPIGSSLGAIAFDRLAQSLGARGVAATTPEAIRRELERALAEPTVTVIHVPIVGGNPQC